LTSKEQKIFKKVGGTFYVHSLGFSDRPWKYADKKLLYNHITLIVKLIKNTSGNILIHCLGGMHRTGVIFAVIQKCYNQISLEKLTENYKCHVDWKNETDQGKYYPWDIETIKDFPCEMLKS